MDLVYRQIEQKLRGQRARIKELEAEVRDLRKGQAVPNAGTDMPEDATTQLNTLLDDARRATAAFRHAAVPGESRGNKR